MNARYSERQNNTPEQVREYLREALDVVDELGPPDDLRVACFTAAVNLVSAKQVTAEVIAPGAAILGQPRL